MPLHRLLISRRTLLVGLVALAAVVVTAKGCMSARTIANRNPLGEQFPTVAGESLEETPVTLPDDLAGAPAVLVPTIASGWIDDGMRAGIPREDWAAVVTLYGGAARPVAALTGTEFPQRTRVLVRDETGEIVWFDDEGYAARKALEIARLVGRRGGG